MAGNPEARPPALRWGRALIAALVAELVLGGLAALLFGNPAPTSGPIDIVVPVAAFIVFIPAGWWTARPAPPGTQLVNGAMPGLWGVVLSTSWSRWLQRTWSPRAISRRPLGPPTSSRMRSRSPAA